MDFTINELEFSVVVAERHSQHILQAQKDQLRHHISYTLLLTTDQKDFIMSHYKKVLA